MIYCIEMAARRWGGRREGAGRPKVLEDRVRILVDLERDEAEALTDLASVLGISRAELIRSAIRNRLRARRREKS